MKIAMIFPGYGSQYVGMGKELYDASRIVQEYFEEASSCLDINFVKLCFAASEVELGRMENAYPALFLMGCSIAALLKHEGVVPAVVTGYDIGQFAALHTAEGISFPDGLYLLSKYAAFFREFLATTKIKSLRIVATDYQEIVRAYRKAHTEKNDATIGIFDSYNGYLVTGIASTIDRVEELLREKNIQTHAADLEEGVHTPLVNDVATNVNLYSAKVDFKTTTIPVIAAPDGDVIQDGTLLKKSTLGLINTAFHWDAMIKRLKLYDLIIFILPQTSLVASVNTAFPEKQCIVVNKWQDIDTIKGIIT